MISRITADLIAMHGKQDKIQCNWQLLLLDKHSLSWVDLTFCYYSFMWCVLFSASGIILEGNQLKNSIL